MQILPGLFVATKPVASWYLWGVGPNNTMVEWQAGEAKWVYLQDMLDRHLAYNVV